MIHDTYLQFNLRKICPRPEREGGSSNGNSIFIANVRTTESAPGGIFSMNNTRLFRLNIMHYSK